MVLGVLCILVNSNSSTRVVLTNSTVHACGAHDHVRGSKCTPTPDLENKKGKVYGTVLESWRY